MLLIFLILVCGVLWYIAEESYNGWWFLPALLLSTFVGVYGLVCFVNYMDTYEMDTRREAIVYSIETLQTDGTFEHLTLDEEVLKYNKSLISYQKWNETFWFGWSINDVVDELEFISVDR